jgi:hypothetical protein
MEGASSCATHSGLGREGRFTRGRPCPSGGGLPRAVLGYRFAVKRVGTGFHRVCGVLVGGPGLDGKISFGYSRRAQIAASFGDSLLAMTELLVSGGKQIAASFGDSLLAMTEWHGFGSSIGCQWDRLLHLFWRRGMNPRLLWAEYRSSCANRDRALLGWKPPVPRSIIALRRPGISDAKDPAAAACPT